jgi:negative regulator of sigma E activity
MSQVAALKDSLNMATVQERVFVCWKMRGVHLLRQFSVHSDGNTEKKHQATRAFCDGIFSFGTLVVCVNRKALGDQECQMKQWSA